MQYHFDFTIAICATGEMRTFRPELFSIEKTDRGDYISIDIPGEMIPFATLLLLEQRCDPLDFQKRWKGYVERYSLTDKGVHGPVRYHICAGTIEEAL